MKNYLLTHILILLLLPAALLLGSGHSPATAQEKLSPQEKKALQQKDAQSDAEEVGVGDYSRSEHVWGTTLQIGVLLTTLLILAFAAWKLQGVLGGVFAKSKELADQRRWKRLSVALVAAEAYFSDQTVTHIQGKAFLRDISPGGVCLELTDRPEDLQPGHELLLQLRLMIGVELTLSNLSGTVRWIRDNKVGIQFSNILYNYDVLEALFPSATLKKSISPTT